MRAKLLSNHCVACWIQVINAIRQIPDFNLSFIVVITATKLLQKSEMRKVIVIELSYKGFSWSGDNSWSHYNPCRSQILTPQRYLFVTMPENATNGHGGRNKTLRNSELPTTHAKNPVTEKDCAVPLRFAYRHRTLHQLILKPKN